MDDRVIYKYGKKETYLGQKERPDVTLYYCTDTGELFRGNKSFSEGVRFVENYSALPAFNGAAQGVLYVCRDSKCGYILNDTLDGWEQVVYGPDNATISFNENGLMQVKAIAIATVTGLADELTRIESLAIGGGAIATKDAPGIIKPGDGFEVSEDGTLSLTAVSIEKVTGLLERLNAIESSIEAIDENIEAEYAKKAEVRSISEMVKYEISSKPMGTLSNYEDKELRVMCPADTEWELQQSGENANPNAYYIGFKAYAPADANSFKEDLAEIISDNTMYYFEGNDFAGIDEYGRKYSIVWLPVATYDPTSGTWTYYGEQSTAEKYIGWYYTVEWYDASGVKIAMDTIRINLANENCYITTEPYYIQEVQSTLTALEESVAWGDM